jgi:hypothetical protein
MMLIFIKESRISYIDFIHSRLKSQKIMRHRGALHNDKRAKSPKRIIILNVYRLNNRLSKYTMQGARQISAF